MVELCSVWITSYHIETNQMICKASQLIGFYIKWVYPERYFRIDYIILAELCSLQLALL